MPAAQTFCRASNCQIVTFTFSNCHPNFVSSFLLLGVFQSFVSIYDSIAAAHVAQSHVINHLMVVAVDMA